MSLRAFSILVLSTFALAGCAKQEPYPNPTFRVTLDEAAARLAQLEAEPRRQLQRPLVILGGFLDFGVGPYVYQKQIERFVDGRIIRITFADCFSFDACRDKLVATLEREFKSDDPSQTTEVDVIGQSMGGLIAIHAAMDDFLMSRRVHIARLFTISSPLGGAKLATWTPFDVFGFQADMRPGSTLYTRLAQARFDFPIYSYTRLDDDTVGEAYASLPGRGVWWVDNPPLERAHIGVFRDDRVLLDIVLRLRGEKPVTVEPPAPLPKRTMTNPTKATQGRPVP